MLSFLLFIAVILIAYLCGSVSSAILVSRIFDLPDPRTEGSKNPGATNVLRLAGKKYAAMVLLGDVFKGIIPVVIARLLDLGPLALGFTCFAAVMGHMYPVFFEFKGGKGVATAIGAMLALNLILGVLVITTWLAVANYSRYSSLASIISIGLSPLYALATIGRFDIIVPLFFIVIFILYQHRNNITRLIDGEEPKVRFRSNEIAEVTEEIITEQQQNPLDEEEAEAQEETAEEPVTTKKKTRQAKPRAKSSKPKATKI